MDAVVVNFAVAMAAIVNPVGKVPLWLACVRGESDAARWRTAVLVMITAGIILLGALWGGTALLNLFSVDLASFRVAGALVVLYTGWTMLQGKAADIDIDEATDEPDPMTEAKGRFRQIIVPMAIPLIAGPGSITTAVIYAERSSDFTGLLVMSAVLVAILGATFGVLMAAPWIRRVIGEIGLTVLTRLAGLLIIAIAMQLMLSGLGEVFPNWVNAESPVADDVAAQEGE